MKNRIFIMISTLAITMTALPTLPSQAAAFYEETLFQEEKDGYQFMVTANNTRTTADQVTMTPAADGCFSVEWKDLGAADCIARETIDEDTPILEYENFVRSYELNVENQESDMAVEYIGTLDTSAATEYSFIRFHIIDACVNEVPYSRYGQKLCNISSDGKTYALYQSTLSLLPGKVDDNFLEFWSFRTEESITKQGKQELSGTVSVNNHIRAYSAFSSQFVNATLESFGLAISASGESGKAEITKNEAAGTPSEAALLATGVTDSKPFPWEEEAFEMGKMSTEIIIPDTVTEIPEKQFYGNTIITKVTIPDSVTKIGNSAFYGCTNLKEVVMGDGVTEIGSEAFYYCQQLTDINLSKNLECIKDFTFASCQALETITVPASVTAIGNAVFQDCTKLHEVNLPEKLESIGEMVFFLCGSLEEITVPEGITLLDHECFAFCTNLKKITLPESLFAMNNNVFLRCEALEEIVIPAGVIEIGPQTFDSCFSLKKVTLPSKLQKIYSLAFQSCTALEEIVIPDGCKAIDEYAFMNCTALKRITIPASVTKIEASAFESTTLEEIIGEKDSYAETYAESISVTFKATEPSIDSVIYGDVNADGKVSIADAVMLQRYTNEEKVDLTDVGRTQADCNHDGSLTAEDVTLILQGIARLIELK